MLPPSRCFFCLSLGLVLLSRCVLGLGSSLHQPAESWEIHCPLYQRRGSLFTDPSQIMVIPPFSNFSNSKFPTLGSPGESWVWCHRPVTSSLTEAKAQGWCVGDHPGQRCQIQTHKQTKTNKSATELNENFSCSSNKRQIIPFNYSQNDIHVMK